MLDIAWDFGTCCGLFADCVRLAGGLLASALEPGLRQLSEHQRHYANF
jgi:hypothetical protein